MLIEHGRDDVDESFIAGKEPVAAGEQIPFEPSLAHVLAQHFHHASVRRDMFIGEQNLRCRYPAGDLKDRGKPVRSGLIRSHDAEVPGTLIFLEHVAQKASQNTRGLLIDSAWLR